MNTAHHPAQEKIPAVKVKDFERQFGTQVDNWLRWGRQRDWLPMSFKSILALKYSGKKRDDDAALYKIPDPINELEALKMDCIVMALPLRQRQAFLLHHMGRASINNRMCRVRNSHDCAKILGVGKWQFYNLLRQASSHIHEAWDLTV